jgi:hypothetical protein
MAHVRTLRGLAALFALGALLPGGAPAAAAVDFPTVVRQILDGQTDGRIANMGASQKSAMIACVIGALDPLPAGRKRYVVEGADFGQQQHRFGEVVNENHAKWKQAIANACAKIALQTPGARDVDHVGTH